MRFLYTNRYNVSFRTMGQREGPKRSTVTTDELPIGIGTVCEQHDSSVVYVPHWLTTVVETG